MLTQQVGLGTNFVFFFLEVKKFVLYKKEKKQQSVVEFSLRLDLKLYG